MEEALFDEGAGETSEAGREGIAIGPIVLLIRVGESDHD